MGRNSGSQVMWTKSYDGTFIRWTWYCQQHRKFQIGDTDPSAWQVHIETEHGNVDQ